MQITRRFKVLGCISILIALTACTQRTETWQIERKLTGLPVHGLQGLNFGPDGGLYIGSVMSEAVVRLDLTSRQMSEVVGPPEGEADDVAFGPNGSMAWTAINQGVLRVRSPHGEIKTVADNLPFVNPVTFGLDGTLYAATLFGPDRLWAYDLTRGTSRIVTEDVGGLNGFEIGADGMLYTPLPMRQAVGRIHVASGNLEVIAENVGDVVGVAWHPDGNLYGASWSDGRVVRISPEGGTAQTVAVVEPPLDNLAVGADGLIYVTRSSDNGVIAVDPQSGVQSIIVRSELAAPGGMTWVMRDGGPRLLITDIFGYRFYDPATGEVELLPFDLEKRASSDADSRDGKIAITNVRRNRALLLDETSGDVLQSWTDLPAPYGVLIDDTGDLVVALHESGTLVRLSAADPAKRDVLTDGLEGPVGLAWANAGTSVYVVEAGAGRISHVSLTTGERRTISSGLSQPETAAVLPDGHIAVTEVGTGQVVLVHPDTGETAAIAKGLALGGPISRSPSPVAMPTGVSVDADGAVWVVTDADNGLLRLSPR